MEETDNKVPIIDEQDPHGNWKGTVQCDRNGRQDTLARKVKVTFELRLECENRARLKKVWGNREEKQKMHRP